MMKFFTFLSTLLIMTGVVSAADPTAAKRKAELLDTVKQGVRKLEDVVVVYVIDAFAPCFGEETSFTTSAVANIDDSALYNQWLYVLKFNPVAQVGNTYTCKLSCDNTAGQVAVYLEATKDYPPSTVNNGLIKDLTNDAGCTGGLELAITPELGEQKNLYFYAEAYASPDQTTFVAITGGKVTCTEASKSNFRSAFSKLTSLLGFGGGGRRLNKYVRGATK